jgi:CheY-like chemotaxis protein/two-component sensor histidine kinase
MGMSSVLVDAEDLTIKEAKDGLSTVMVSSRMLLTLINNLLDVRKCDESLLDGFQLSAVPLAKSLQECTDFCRPIASVTNVSVCSHVGSDCKHVSVQSNPIRFQQILINLTSNAIKYTKPGSKVRICATVMTMPEVNEMMDKALECGIPRGQSKTSAATTSDQKLVVVSVCDSGDGVPASSAGKVFQRFSQSTATRSINAIGQNTVAQPTGTGLGLNLCVKFVERMRGNIWVTNDPKGGARFSFYLPVATDASVAACSATSQTPVSIAGRGNVTDDPGISTARKKKRNSGGAYNYKVLVVDDTIINLKVMDKMLSRIGVKNVKTLDSGGKALAYLEEESVDLVLTDIQMPHMSGHELSEKIHHNSKLVCSPTVVAMTAETSERLHERCRSSGIVHVLHKPITAPELERFFSETVAGLVCANRHADFRGNQVVERLW